MKIVKIIDELARAFVRARKKDSFAVVISVAMAVVVLGTFVFIVEQNRVARIDYIKETIGDYHILLSEQNPAHLRELQEAHKVRAIEFETTDRLPIDDDSNRMASLLLEDKSAWTGDRRVHAGKKPQAPDEVLCEERVLKEMQIEIGDTVRLGDREYTVVGTERSDGYSFEDQLFFGRIYYKTPEEVFAEHKAVSAKIWFENMRDTYPQTRAFLAKYGLKDEDLQSTGVLAYNEKLLQEYLVFPQGIVPTAQKANEWIESFGAYAILIALFAGMIRNAFGVWDRKDRRYIALLKSVGATKKQIRALVVKKALMLSGVPILIGTAASYLLANGILYLMWWNNHISYKNITRAGVRFYGEIGGFQPIPLRPTSVILILVLSLVCVLFSALGPARKTAKQTVAESLRPDRPKVRKSARKERLSKNSPVSLGKDYLRAYAKTYRGIAVAMALASAVLSLYLVVGAWRNLNETHNHFRSPYTFTGTIHRRTPLSPESIAALRATKGLEDLQIYHSFSAKFYEADNKDILSDAFQDALASGNRDFENPYCMFYGIQDDSFRAIQRENGLAEDPEAFLLVNATPEKTVGVPYDRRQYIPLTDKMTPTLIVRDHLEAPAEEIPIAGHLERIPYELEGFGSREVAVVTSLSHLERYAAARFVDEEDALHYELRANIDETRETAATEAVSAVIAKDTPRSDYELTPPSLRRALDAEVRRNEVLLAVLAQGIFIAIGLSNAYSSFHTNMLARRRDFGLLHSAGMTRTQIREMVATENRILIRRLLIGYSAILVAGAVLQSARKHFMFSPLAILGAVDYTGLLLFVLLTTLGILAATKSAEKEILNEGILDLLS